MAVSFDLVEDDGFATVKIGPQTIEIDVWKVWGDIDGLRAQSRANQDVDMLALIQEYLGGIGFTGRISQKAANQFLKWHAALVNVEGKAEPGDSKQDSPGSTEPASSASEPE